MKISQLIAELEARKAEHGDIECYWLDDGYCLTKVDEAVFTETSDDDKHGHCKLSGSVHGAWRRPGADAQQFILIG